MDLDIAGENALIMSSTRGLGFGCAKMLASEGAHVIINGRNKERGLEAVSKLGGNAFFIPADISIASERERLFKEAEGLLGDISILVTNVEGPPPGPFMSKTLEDWQAAFELLMLPALDMVCKCLPGMIDHGFGRIVNISSTSSKEIHPGYPLSNGIKPGLLGALGTLAREVSSQGVTINSLLPGPFDTDLMRRSALKALDRKDISEEEAVKIYSQNDPMKRWGTIEEFGALCAFLCSRHAGYITGQSIVIDGGQVSSLF